MSKNVLVTGSSSGLGRVICEHLLRNSDHLLIGLDQKAQGFLHNEPRYRHIQCNLLDFASVRNVIDENGLGRGSLDILVNCAGVMPTALVSKLDPQVALDAFSVNCVAPMYLSRLLLKALARADNPAIINITSIAAELDIPGEIVYGATKAALKHASEAMAIELARFGIRVNCVAPALVVTPMTEHLSDVQREYMLMKQACKDNVTPEDVARIVSYLIEAPAGTTGSTVYAGGIAR